MRSAVRRTGACLRVASAMAAFTSSMKVTASTLRGWRARLLSGLCWGRNDHARYRNAPNRRGRLRTIGRWRRRLPAHLWDETVRRTAPGRSLLWAHDLGLRERGEHRTAGR